MTQNKVDFVTVSVNFSLYHYKILKDKYNTLAILKKYYNSQENFLKAIQKLKKERKLEEVYLNIVNNISYGNYQKGKY